MTAGEADRDEEGELSLTCSRLSVVPAGTEDAPLVQACFDEAAGYFVKTEGAPPAPDAAARLLADVEVDDRRRVFVARPLAGGPVVGLLDLHLHHPEPGVAHVGLLLLRDSWRGQGYGRELAVALEAALERSGYRALSLSVVRANAEARAFWEAMGFAEAGRAEGGVTVFEKVLR